MWQGDAGLNAGFATAVPRGHFARSAEGARDVVGFPKDAPVELPREAWPMLVAFDDITKPETVREVDPEDLAAVFGEGVRLKAVTLEITKEAVTEGRLDNLPRWLGPYPEPALGPSTGESLDDSPFFLQVLMGDFIRRSD